MRPAAFCIAMALIGTMTPMAHSQSNFESSKLSPGVVVQGSGLESSKLSSGVVVQGNSLESSKFSAGIVVNGLAFQSPKVSIGIVVNTVAQAGGVIPRAPLTHW